MTSAQDLDLVLQHPSINYDIMPPFNALVQEPPRAISSNYARWHGIADKPEVTAATVKVLCLQQKVDAGLAPSQRKLSDFKLIAFDMDSTLINIECLDEIADFAGKKAEVAAITEAAMRGEIKDYAESLRRRVKFLAGLPESVLAQVYEQRLKLNPGAKELVLACQQAGLKILLVSGGFTYFTERLQQQLGLDYVRSNQLEIIDGKLTGEVLGDIVDASVKQKTVLQLCEQLGCSPMQAIACGDGSNDLKMMEVVGLSFAYKAKPIVQEKASYAINHNGLDAALRFIEPRRTSIPYSPQVAHDLLWTTWKAGQVIASLPANNRPLNRRDGYSTQACLEKRSQAPLFGWKIAATSLAGQQHIGVSGPLAGRFLAEQVVPEGSKIGLTNNRMRVAECEFAFRFKSDLPPKDGSYTQAQVLAAVASLHPAIEIPDARFEKFETVGEAQLIADNACAHQFVLGKASTANWRSFDLSKHAVTASQENAGLRKNHHGVGSNVLGDPRIALTWLVNELSALGETLKAGQVVTTGTCLVPIQVQPGDLVRADFGALGEISVGFEGV